MLKHGAVLVLVFGLVSASHAGVLAPEVDLGFDGWIKGYEGEALAKHRPGDSAVVYIRGHETMETAREYITITTRVGFDRKYTPLQYMRGMMKYGQAWGKSLYLEEVEGGSEVSGVWRSSTPFMPDHYMVGRVVIGNGALVIITWSRMGSPTERTLDKLITKIQGIYVP